MKKSFFLCFVISFLTLSCSEDEMVCDPLVLDLKVDKESKEWLPESYYRSESLFFINDQGETKEFKNIGLYNSVSVNASMGYCGEEYNRQIRTFYEYFSGYFESADTVIIHYKLNNYPNACEWEGYGYESMDDFGDFLEIAVYDDKTKMRSGLYHEGFFGILSKIVKYPVVPKYQELNPCNEYFEEVEAITLVGVEYSDVFAASRPKYPERFIYFKKGMGIIGFVDTDGVTWRLEN